MQAMIIPKTMLQIIFLCIYNGGSVAMGQWGGEQRGKGVMVGNGGTFAIVVVVVLSYSVFLLLSLFLLYFCC